MQNNRDLPSLARQRYFDRTVYIKEIKDCISGRNEKKVMKVFDSLGYKLDEDYVRQHPIGERFVLDFAFVELRLAIEVDGVSHNYKKQKKVDRMRDNFLHTNDWVVIRVNEKDFFNVYKMSFYKNLIKQVVTERRIQRQKGNLFHIDIPRFIQTDYEGFR